MAQVAVIGLGRFGHHVAMALNRTGHEVLAVDVDPEKIQRIRDHCAQAIVLDASDKEQLASLGLEELDVVVVSLGQRLDVSALVTLHLKELGVRKVITKAGSVDHAKLLDLIGSDEIVFPERDAAERLAYKLTNVRILDYIPLGESYSIHEMAPPEGFVGKTLRDLKLRNRFGVQILAVRDALTDHMQINPDPELLIKDSDVLVVLGENEALNRLRRS